MSVKLDLVGGMTSAEKFLLRSVAMTEDLPASKRLDALDRLCAAENVFCSRRYACAAYVKPPDRSRKFAVRALRSILKTKRSLMGTTRVAVMSRLLFLKTGRDLMDEHNRQYLYRIGPENPNQKDLAPEQKSSAVIEIEAALAKYRNQEKTNGSQDAR